MNKKLADEAAGSSKTTLSSELVRKVQQQFLIGAAEDLMIRLAALTDCAGEFSRDPAMTFQSNLTSAITVGSLPFRMSQAAVVNHRYNAIRTAERIRMLRPPGEPQPFNAEEIARERAIEKFQKEMHTNEFTEWSRDQIVLQLGEFLKDQEFGAAANELLRQSLVMVWGAFEVLANEIVIRIVNRNPSLTKTLVSNESTRKYFPGRGISIDMLAEHSFDLAASMGDALFAGLHFDRLPMIRDVMSVIFSGSSDLLRSISDDALWLLWQRRHLIVHKRGVVDKSYINKTNDSQSLGAVLVVNSNYLEDAMRVVIDAGSELLKADNALSVGSPVTD